MDSFEEKLQEFFVNRLPGLSSDWKEKVAKFFPWVTIVFGVLGLLAWLSSIRFVFGYAGAFGHMYGFDMFMMVYYVISPIVQALYIYSAYLMLSRQYKGWRIVLYSLFLGFVSHLLYFSVVGIFFDFLFVYLLFQIKEYFTDQIAA